MKSVKGRWLRRLACAVLAATAVGLFDPGAALAEPGVPAPPNELLSDSGKGAVSAADRDFVVKVRLAGLWEIPAGEMAQQKSKDPRIQNIGRQIAAQHVVLDKLDREAAKKLNIEIPKIPNSDQQGWLGEMRDAQGKEFDQIYIDRLRAAHGKIFPAIATIRASTRNDTVRKLAQRANQFVMTHMTLLESSGIVDFAALPTAPAPTSAAPSSSARATTATAAERPAPTGLAGGVLAAVLIAGLAAGLFATWRVVAAQGRRRRRETRARYDYYETGRQPDYADSRRAR
ncbi:DUF4142 domain-containing protein [Actinoplanes sp. CA-030573]|uniref:DUF4142 domain-containing protein n=1 Tax=Actinoplanes sp. CA-030573 TaxID=3239898 RepID=UPI003D939A2B